MTLFEQPTTSTAHISPCGRYRYQLGRRRGTRPATALFIMLNPSTADADQDDPTIRRCISFAKRESCDALTVVNLFAWRATKPADLPEAVDIATGPENTAVLLDALADPDTAVAIAAWGANKRTGDVPILGYAERSAQLLYCLGRTAAGHPRHPLYVRADQRLEYFTNRTDL